MRRWRRRWGLIGGRELGGNGSARDGLEGCTTRLLDNRDEEVAMLKHSELHKLHGLTKG